jgi:hypothetical protein
VNRPTAVQVECFKSVAARYAGVIGPELQCEIRRTRAQNDCYADLECDDTAGWDACYEAGGDCDDSFTESHEEEVRACAEGGGPGTGGAGGSEPGTGGTTGSGDVECTSDADCGLCTSSEELGCCQCPFVSAVATCDDVESAQCAGLDCAARECPAPPMPACEGGRCVAARAENPTPQPAPGACASDADCVVCDVTILNGLVQCCMPCGMVTSADQCEQNQALAGQCAAVACPAIACTSTPVPRCVSGTCSAGTPRL